VVDFSSFSKNEVDLGLIKKVGKQCKKVNKLVLNGQFAVGPTRDSNIYVKNKSNNKYYKLINVLKKYYHNIKELDIKNVDNYNIITLTHVFTSCLSHPTLEIIHLKNFTINIKDFKEAKKILGFTISWKSQTTAGNQFIIQTGMNDVPVLKSGDFIKLENLKFNNISNARISLKKGDLDIITDFSRFESVEFNYGNDGNEGIDELIKLFGKKKKFEELFFNGFSFVNAIKNGNKFIEIFKDVNVDSLKFGIDDIQWFDEGFDLESFKTILKDPFFQNIKNLDFSNEQGTGIIVTDDSQSHYLKNQEYFIKAMVSSFPQLERLHFGAYSSEKRLNIFMEALLKYDSLFPNLVDLTVVGVDYNEVDFSLLINASFG
jgi:hypothetical protein